MYMNTFVYVYTYHTVHGRMYVPYIYGGRRLFCRLQKTHQKRGMAMAAARCMPAVKTSPTGLVRMPSCVRVGTCHPVQQQHRALHRKQQHSSRRKKRSTVIVIHVYFEVTRIIPGTYI